MCAAIMIKITVDEAYAFDFLSILQVKYDRLGNATPYRNTLAEIKNQLEEKLVDAILVSKEYYSLYDLNDKIFLLLETVSTSDILAKEIDELNYARFLAKRELQHKFFNNTLAEKKSR